MLSSNIYIFLVDSNEVTNAEPRKNYHDKHADHAEALDCFFYFIILGSKPAHLVIISPFQNILRCVPQCINTLFDSVL